MEIHEDKENSCCVYMYDEFSLSPTYSKSMQHLYHDNTAKYELKLADFLYLTGVFICHRTKSFYTV